MRYIVIALLTGCVTVQQVEMVQAPDLDSPPRPDLAVTAPPDLAAPPVQDLAIHQAPADLTAAPAPDLKRAPDLDVPACVPTLSACVPGRACCLGSCTQVNGSQVCCQSAYGGSCTHPSDCCVGGVSQCLNGQCCSVGVSACTVNGHQGTHEWENCGAGQVFITACQ